LDAAALTCALSLHDALPIFRTEEVVPEMGGEDFAYYMLERPGAYFFTGAQKEDHAYPHHHPKFDIDERALPVAAKTLIQAYFDRSEEHTSELQSRFDLVCRL